MGPEAIDAAAAWLAQARPRGVAVTGCLHAAALAGEASGYAVQERLHERFAAAGSGPLVGYKVGCTNKIMQEMLGVSGPAYGGLMAAKLHRDQGRFSIGAFAVPGVECEIAVWIGRDMGPAGAPYDRDKAADHVAACSAAMEIVDNRYEDFRTAPLGLMIADDFFQAASVVGPRVEAWRALDLAEVTGRVSIDGEMVASGQGRNVMDHPLEVVAWLANRLAERGRALAAGHLVLTGSMVPVQWLASEPCRVEMEVEGLGRVRAAFG